MTSVAIQTRKYEDERTFGVSEVANIIRENKSKTYSNVYSHSIYFDNLLDTADERLFSLLKEQWLKEVRFLSNTTKRHDNENYRSIISMGESALPFIIQDLRNSENHWFYALEQITNFNPVKKEHNGNLIEMKKDWVKWYEGNN